MAQIDALLDTNVLIDIWRNNAPAVQWLKDQSATVLGIPVIASMELLDGVRDAAERQRALKFLQTYPVIQLTVRDSRWAQMQHTQYKLSHNIGIGDVLIAAPAARLGVPIYTLNTKHFTPLPDVTAIKPY